MTYSEFPLVNPSSLHAVAEGQWIFREAHVHLPQRFLFALNAASKLPWRLAKAFPSRRSAKSFLKFSRSRYGTDASAFCFFALIGTETNLLDLRLFQADFYTLKELEKFSFKRKGIGTFAS